MESKFSIIQLCELKDRPPISHKVRDYFVQFIIEEVLIPKKIILSSNWNIQLAFMFMQEGLFGPKGVYAYKPDTFGNVKLKSYPVIIPLNPIRQSKNPQLKTIELMYEGISMFFTTFYKKITSDFMHTQYEKVNIEYLLSLPYPAEIAEQKYVGDIELPGGAVIVQDQ